MKCPKCQFENPAGMKFCGECGASLQDIQPPSDFRPEHAKTSFVPEPERKHVTALFSDLSGYTAMTEKLDPEQVKEITSRIFTGVRQIVAKYEGFIERVMGDGCLAFFGIPRAHEDDPIRAIHAAMEIHELVKRLNPQYEARVGAPLTMHSGINTGLVVTADVDPEKGTHGVAGDAVNVASRLSNMAGPGEIFVGEETVRRAKERFVFDPLGQKRAKGKAEPIIVFKVVSVKASVLGTRVDRHVSSEMVGRDKELDKLEFQVMKAINGEGSVVNVIGEAGIGKSRLIAELKKSHIMKRVTLLEGRAISIGKNLSFHPIIDLLKQWSGIAEGDSEAAAFDKLEKAIRQVHPEETHEILPFVATLMGMKLTGKHAERVKGIEGEALEKLIFKNVRELLIKGSELRPTVVVIEDLHWADTSSIELLVALYHLAERHKIAFINVFRPGYWQAEDWPVERIGELLSNHFVEIPIQSLDQDVSEALIRNIIDIKGLPYSLRVQIGERAGGNPFFIEEVVRSLIDEGAIVRSEGSLKVTEKIDSVIIPTTINDVLMARIDRLEERTRELVKVASVIGRSFFDRVIKEVADSIEDIDVKLAYLKDLQLIRERIRMEELEYLFKHALAQEAAYESTLLLQRKSLHRKVAQSIEKVFQGRLHEFYGMLAYHYSKADDPEKAEAWMVKAGEEALRSSASAEALSYFQQALKLYLAKYGADADEQRLATFEKNIALSFFDRGQFSQALEYFDKVLNRWGRRSSHGTMRTAARLVYDLATVMLDLQLPSLKRKKTPTERDKELFDVWFKRNVALVYVDNLKAFAECVGLIGRITHFHAAEIPNGSQCLSAMAGHFSFAGMLFNVSGKLLEQSESTMSGSSTRNLMAYKAMDTIRKHCLGAWNAIDTYDDHFVDLALRDGELWTAATYILVYGYVKTEQGQFSDLKWATTKLFEIGEAFHYELARIYYGLLITDYWIRKREPNHALREAETASSLAGRTKNDLTQLQFIGYKVTSQVMMHDLDAARESLSIGMQLIKKQKFVPPLSQAPFLVGALFASNEELNKTNNAEAKSVAQKHRRMARLSMRAALRNARKYALYRTWVLQLSGDNYWLVGKQGKAIKEGERLGARPDLSRTYFEVGKRLLEPQSKYKQLNGIDANGYFEKAETLFKEMGLERDLEDLERVRQGA